MDNFKSEHDGYNKNEVNNFVDFVIKRTEDHIELIKNQQEEINKLQNLVEAYRQSQSNIDFIKQEIANTKLLAEKEANMIISEARANADKIVNDALVKTEKLNLQKQELNRTIHIYKKKIRNTLMEQLDAIDDIEIL
jgi:Cell division initiation protein